MATGEIVRDEPAAQAAAARRPRSNVQEKSFWLTLVEAAASLRLTVTLFAMLIFLIFMGTLAQKDQGVWQVVEQTYFRVGFAWIDFQAFARLVQLWTKTPIDNVPGGFWFPGGTLLGVLLGVNLLAAHSLRFRVAASGQRLVAGVAVTAIGLGLGAALVLADQRGAVEGVFTSNVQGILWHALRASVAGMALFTAYLFAVSKKPVLSPERVLAGAIALITGAIAVWLYANPAVQLNPSGLRILWLLALCLVVSVVCNAGCVLLFKKRSGIVLLHAGVLLLMIGELIVGLAADEGQMTIPEGGSSNYAVDIRTSELAIVDASNPQEDVVTVVPQRLLAKDEVIEGEGLPFKIKPLEFQPNSFLVPPNAKAANPSTKGAGLAISAMPTKQVSGVDTKQGVDMPSVYAELLDPETDESLGVYLFSASVDRNENALTPQQVEVGGKTYDVALRFKRQYKPYSVELVDFRFDKFIGTTTAKNYSSDVIIHDDARSIDREARISMNNPTRHAGDTLYQSSFDRTETATVLQVVTNTGRLIPYLSCVMVGVGLFTHFGQTLLRFFDRRDREVAKLATQSHEAGHAWTSPAVVVPAVVTLLVAACVAVQARSGKPDVEAFPVGRFGSLAMVDGGRVKPYDTYARTVLQRLSNRQEINLKKLEEAERPACADGLDKVSASKWLLDVVSGREGAGDYRVFRIDNLDLLDSLKLEARTGSFRYSLNEILARQSKTEADDAETGDQTPSVPEFNRQVDLAAAVAPGERNLFQSRVLALAENISRYRVMDGAFRSFGILGVESFPEGFAQQVAEAAMSLRRAEAPLPVPPQAVDDSWKTVLDAEIESFLKRRQGGDASVALVALEDALNAYKKQDLRAFTESLDILETQYAKYQKQLNSPLNAEAVEQLKPAERLSLTKASFETWFNQFSPFTVAAVLYVIAFLFAVSSWVFAPKVLGRTAMAIVALTLALHTFAILGRLYISGRPPVTNLYSSAVFIGWAMVVFGLIIDGVYRVGVGTALGAAAGFLSMLIAYFLGQDGDTFTVMQAVLDTQFWLATHVVCITLGYGATFMAGALGLAYLAFRNPTLFCGVLAVAIVVLRPILGVEAASGYGLAMNATVIGLIAFAVLFAYKPGGRADTEIERLLTRVTYGVLCFALFFSFIGTVLGGLWADDSWGRFWGWDPKENGAMIIVLWNALILHARWGAMITPRGFAALAVVGNIVTTWSWFGTNELGVGLHAYGGVSDEMSLGLGIMTTALITHLPLLPLASCPRDAWRAWFGGGETAAT